jgi:hypothetical protein
VAEHVDEARRDGHTARVDLGSRARGIDSGDLRDAVAGDRDIGDERRAAGAIVDVPAAQDQVEGLLGVRDAAARLRFRATR